MRLTLNSYGHELISEKQNNLFNPHGCYVLSNLPHMWRLQLCMSRDKRTFTPPSIFFFLSTSSQPFMMLSSNATAVRTHVISCPIVTAVFGISSQSNPLWLLFIITYVRFLFNNRICHCTVLRRRVCH